MRKNPWKTLSSKVVYKNDFITVTEDKVIRPDGKKGIYGFVKIPRTIGIVALDNEKNIYLCRQYRYIFQDESWEIPRGFVDKNESPLKAAERELGEEAGLTAKKLTFISSLRLSIGIMDEECKVYLAQELSKIKDFSVQKEEIEKVRKISFQEVLSMIKKGIIVDGLTVGAVLMLKEYLNGKISIYG